MTHVIFKDLGLVDYKKAWDYQEQLLSENVAIKIANRKELNSSLYRNTTSYLLFCEHPHVFTLGKSGSENNLLVNETELKNKQARFYKINRGGDITYHGPGQIVGYPILDLELFFTDIHKYLRFLEEAIILTLQEYNINSGRVQGYTGVWVDYSDEFLQRKICAMGVRCSRWVTMHGFALNVNTDLSYFGNIIPCGINNKPVTSIQKELGKEIDIQEVKHKLKKHLTVLFNMKLIDELNTTLQD